MTAAVVAATLLLLRDDEELGHLIDQHSLDGVERAVRYMMPVAGWALDHLPWSAVKTLGFGFERAFSPSFVTHYALRKSAIRIHLERAIADGCQQVVLLGAGFDMLSAAIAPGVDVFEVDLPATQEAKRRALDGFATREVTLVPADLSRTSLRDVLSRAPGFDPARETVFVAEGLFMYLDVPTVERAFADIASAARRTHAILSFVTPDRRGRVRLHSQRRVVDLCMRFLGEPFVFGDYPTRIEERLARHSLRVERTISNEELCASLPRSARHRGARTSGEVIIVTSNRPDIARVPTPARATAQVA
jgi:methyltransferase (TIGR00027 family)